MDQEIENLRFDTSDNNNDYNVHQCQVGDGDSNCAYGLNPLRYSKNDHSYYYGVPVGNYGRVGCVVISGGQGYRLQFAATNSYHFPNRFTDIVKE